MKIPVEKRFYNNTLFIIAFHTIYLEAKCKEILKSRLFKEVDNKHQNTFSHLLGKKVFFYFLDTLQ